MKAKTTYRLPILLAMLLTLSSLAGCWKAATDRVVDYSKKKVVETGENFGKAGVEGHVVGASDLVPLLDHEGNPVFNKNGHQAFVSRTTMVQDITNLANGGAGWQSILMYIFSAIVWVVSNKLGGKKVEKRMGNLLDVKKAALDIVTSRINKAAGNGGGTIIANLMESIGLAANRHTAVGATIHESAKVSVDRRGVAGPSTAD